MILGSLFVAPRWQSFAARAFAVALVAIVITGSGRACAVSRAASPAEEDFDRAVKPFLRQHCDRCHSEKVHEAEFRLDNLSRDVAMGPSGKKWAEVLERIASAQMPPEDEPKPNVEEATKVVEYLAAKLKEGDAARLAKRERVTLNKLTRVEYANTIHDLLGVHFDPADPTGLAEDEAWQGFERIGSVLSLSPSHIEKYLAAAESVLNEALPEKPPVKFLKRKDGIDLRNGNRAELEAQGLADKVRVELWPGAELQGGRPGPGQALPAAGVYKVRIQLSGLKPKNGKAPHLVVYAPDLDRLMFEQDIVAPEDKPTVVEFTSHLPAGNINITVSNEVQGPSNLPRSGRADPRIPFFSTKDGRRPWQIKLTDEDGEALWPFLIIDSIEWSGPIVEDGPTYAQREYLPAESGNMQQARECLDRFVERAFRRPARPVEVDRLVKLVESEMAAGEKFLPAMKTAMLAVLCSKDFFYLVEGSPETNATELNDWELASRLSYFLWSTMPDQELFDAARQGKLRTPEVLRAQVKRMLANKKAERFTKSFPRDWLQLQMVGMFPPDKAIYPDYDAHLEKSMIGETTAFFAEVLNKNLSLAEFLDSNWTMLNPRLALHYKLPELAEDRFQRVPLTAEANRGGLLTQAAILSLTSDGTRHRPVHRGKWVSESILGKSPPPPPANVKPIEPTPATQPKATLRMKLDAHKSDASCASCHKRIDPLGFAFDNYDAIGRWRTEEVVSDGNGQNPKVDASGELVDGRKFSDAASFKKLLLSDLNKFNATFIEKLATFGVRRVMTISDRDSLDKLAKQSQANSYRVQNVVEEFVVSDLFRKR